MKNNKNSKQTLQIKPSSKDILQTVKTVAEKYDQQKREISNLFNAKNHWINDEMWSPIKDFFELWTFHIDLKNDQIFKKKVTLRFFRVIQDLDKGDKNSPPEILKTACQLIESMIACVSARFSGKENKSLRVDKLKDNKSLNQFLTNVESYFTGNPFIKNSKGRKNLTITSRIEKLGDVLCQDTNKIWKLATAKFALMEIRSRENPDSESKILSESKMLIGTRLYTQIRTNKKSEQMRDFVDRNMMSTQQTVHKLILENVLLWNELLGNIIISITSGLLELLK